MLGMLHTLLRRVLPVALAVCWIDADALATNIITIGNASGFPGETVTVTVSLANDDPISAFQFTFRDVPDSLTGIDVTALARLSGFVAPDFNEVDPDGVLNVVIFAFGNQAPPGTGNIFTIDFLIEPGTPSGQVTLTAENVVLSNPFAQEVPHTIVNGSVTVLPHMTISAHPAGQIPDQFGAPGVSTLSLHRFTLTEARETATVSSVIFRLSDVSGLTAGSFANMSIVRDANGNGLIDPSETQTVGGTGAVIINGNTGTITFSSPFAVPTGTRHYILQGLVTTINGSRMALNMGSADITATGATAGAIIPVGSVSASIHVAGSLTLSDHAGNGQLADLVIGPGTLTDAPLFRFSVVAHAEDATMDDLTFDLTLDQINPADLAGLSLFEDTDADGNPDGDPIAVNPSITDTDIAYQNIGYALNRDQIVSFVLQGSVALEQPGAEMTLDLPESGLAVTDDAGHSMETTGDAASRRLVSAAVLLSDAPDGQFTNRFSAEGSLTGIDLFRFSLSASGEPGVFTDLSIGVTLEELNEADLSAFALFEDTDGDGLPDGEALAQGTFTANIAEIPVEGELSFSGLDLSLGKDQPRIFIIQGTVSNIETGDRLTLTLDADGISAALPDDAAMAVTGAISPATHIAGAMTLSDAPEGQVGNAFDRVASADQKPLYRFSISAGIPLSVERFTIDYLIAGLSPEDIFSIQLFEDTDDNGLPDGEPLSADISTTPDAVILDNLNLTLPAGTSRAFVIIGSVALSHIGDQLTLSLSPAGVAAATDQQISITPTGIATDAVHTATGFSGDVNFDFAIDIRDLIKEINVVLGKSEIDGALFIFDVNNDEAVNIVDVIAIIHKILNNRLPIRPVMDRDDSPVIVALQKGAGQGNGSLDIDVRIEAPASLTGLQFTLSASDPAIRWQTPRLHHDTDHVMVMSHGVDGTLRVVIYSRSGAPINPTRDAIMAVGATLSGHLDPSAVVSIRDVYAVDAGLRPMPVTLARSEIILTGRPEAFSLLQNAPNPFNPVTTIRYDLPEPSHVLLAVYNLLGQRVITLTDGKQKAGRYTLQWDGRNTRGEPVASGIYVYRLTTDSGYTATRKMILLR